MPTQFTAHRGLILLLGLLTAFGPMSIDMYLPAFPAIAREFGVPISYVQYTLASFNLGIALGQLCYGPLADRFGRRPNLIAGLIIYALAAVGCALAASVDMLILTRFLQALGGCTGMVLTRAIVRDKFAGNESAGIFSTLMLIMGVAPILAPTVGGFIIAHGHWRYIFWLMAAVSSLTLLRVLWALPETLPAERRNPRALHSAFRTYGELLRDREFMGFSLTSGMTYGAMFAYITGSSFVFIRLFGLSEQQYGIMFGLNAAGLIAASQLNTRLLRRYSYGQILRRAMGVHTAAGLVLLGTAATGLGGLWGLLLPLFLVIGSVGLINPNAAAGAMAAHTERAGSASALLGTLMFSCGALAAVGVSLLAPTSALPMAAVIAACGIIGLFISQTMTRSRATAIPVSEAA